MAPSSRDHPSVGAISYLINHVVLPPKLPQEDDHDAKHEQHIFHFMIGALQDLHNVVKVDYTEVVKKAITTVENLRDGRDDRGDVSEVQLEALLTKLTNSETIGALPLEIKKQNAGILISRCANNLNFEFFELSPTNEAAMQLGRLVRTFPGHVSKIPVSKMTSDLQKSLAGTIAKMTTQAAPGFQPRVRKGGETLDEDRDTTHPGLVTDFLMNIITAIGDTTNVQRISKNTREETLWNDCLQPWRRSPLWLLLRVSLHLHFVRNSRGLQSSDSLYKAFMIFLLSRLLSSVCNMIEYITNILSSLLNILSEMLFEYDITAISS